MTGTVCMYRPDKQFGFILADETKTEVFFHASNKAADFTPIVGTRVTYRLAPPIRLGKALQAVDVQAVL